MEKPFGLCEGPFLTVKSFPGGIFKKFIQNGKRSCRVADKADRIIVHAGANDITKGANSLNLVKKIIKNVKRNSPITKLVLSVILLKKYLKGTDRY